MSKSNGLLLNTSLPPTTIRPLGVYSLSGLTVDPQTDGGCLLATDSVRGYLIKIDPLTNNTVILNPHNLADWTGVTGLAYQDGTLWFGKDQEVLTWGGLQPAFAQADLPAPSLFTHLPYPVNGVAVWKGMVYVSCQKSGYIHGFDPQTGELQLRFPQPGVGSAALTVTEAGLWVCDRTEQMVYCLDPTTGAVQFSALTPFSSPTGITFYSPGLGQDPICYVAYADEEPYIRDDPNSASPYQLTFRDRTFIHPLYLYRGSAAPVNSATQGTNGQRRSKTPASPSQPCYTLSNGYRVELSYVEELLPLEALSLHNVEWRIALPANTLRQRVCQIEPMGHPFTLEEQDGQQVAVFRFEHLQPHQGGLLGWKAILDLYSLKYHLAPADIETNEPLPPEFQRYLVDDDELAMDHPVIQQAAREAIGTETHVLRKMLKIRNYVYDRLSYGIQPRIDPPNIVLERGVASCGEYVGVLLALARLNGIACRTIGRYKCPPYPDRRYLPLEPDFNHVWLEFYLPGVGWLPMESNVDDVVERGPYPERFFMGLAWYHTEIGKGIPFTKMTADDRPENFSLGDLAINHIRFRILDELMPGADGFPQVKAGSSKTRRNVTTKP
jgi:transglutaminase-like putative cysteine protease